MGPVVKRNLTVFTINLPLIGNQVGDIRAKFFPHVCMVFIPCVCLYN